MNIGEPWRFSRLSLTSVKTFVDVEIVFEPPTEDGQWIVLLGDNGAGKTTILKMIALCLAERDAVTYFLQDQGRGVSYVRRGTDMASAAITGNGRVGAVAIQNTGQADYLDSGESSVPYAEDLSDVFVVGYGSARGSGHSQKSSPSVRSAERLASLFDPQASLLDPIQWLQNARMESYETNDESSKYDLARQALLELLPGVIDLHVDSKDVDVVYEDKTRMPLLALSDGYLTTAAWVLDMVASWIESVEFPSDKPISIRDQMAGVCLVDEISMHLHPSWQREIVRSLRKAFPRMTFVVTTHSPLVALDLKPGELHVVRQDPDDRTSTVEAKDPVPGNVSEMLIGSWFQLNTSLDRGTVELIEAKRKMMASDDVDPVAIREIDSNIRRRMTTFSGATAESLALKLSTEYTEENLRDMKPEELESARKRLREMIKEARSQ